MNRHGATLAPGRQRHVNATLLAVLVQLVQPNENLAGLGTVRRTENAGLVQLVDDAGGTTIPDPEFSLQERRRPELVLDAGLGRLAEELVALPRRSGPVP